MSIYKYSQFIGVEFDFILKIEMTYLFRLSEMG